MMRTDEQLEAEIIWASLKWQSAKGPVKLRAAFKEFQALVAQRSPQQIRKMELERGIHTPEGK